MELNSETTKLICDLERIVGGNCFNPNSLNGVTMVEGLGFRYPVCYTDSQDRSRKTKYTITGINPEQVNTIRYQFGSNHLYIGDALVHILEHLEKEYGLDFNKIVSSK